MIFENFSFVDIKKSIRAGSPGSPCRPEGPGFPGGPSGPGGPCKPGGPLIQFIKCFNLFLFFLYT